MLDVGGLGVVELKAFDRYRRVTLSDTSLADRDRALQDIVAYAPRFVWVFLGGSFANPVGVERSSFVVALDEALSANAGVEPFYVLGPRSVVDVSLQAWADANPSIRDRTVGVASSRPADATILGAAAARYAAAYL